MSAVKVARNELSRLEGEESPAKSKFCGEERFHASPLTCCDRVVIHRSKEFIHPEAKLLHLVGEVARRAEGGSHARE